MLEISPRDCGFRTFPEHVLHEFSNLLTHVTALRQLLAQLEHSRHERAPLRFRAGEHCTSRGLGKQCFVTLLYSIHVHPAALNSERISFCDRLLVSGSWRKQASALTASVAGVRSGALARCSNTVERNGKPLPLPNRLPNGSVLRSNSSSRFSNCPTRDQLPLSSPRCGIVSSSRPRPPLMMSPLCGLRGHTGALKG